MSSNNLPALDSIPEIGSIEISFQQKPSKPKRKKSRKPYVFTGCVSQKVLYQLAKLPRKTAQVYIALAFTKAFRYEKLAIEMPLWRYFGLTKYDWIRGVRTLSATGLPLPGDRKDPSLSEGYALQGPIPVEWLRLIMPLTSSAFILALLIWLRHKLVGEATFTLPASWVKALSWHKATYWRNIQKLTRANIITVSQPVLGAPYRITILHPVAPSPYHLKHTRTGNLTT
jgi:hypothetical protein